MQRPQPPATPATAAASAAAASGLGAIYEVKVEGVEDATNKAQSGLEKAELGSRRPDRAQSCSSSRRSSCQSARSFSSRWHLAVCRHLGVVEFAEVRARLGRFCHPSDASSCPMTRGFPTGGLARRRRQPADDEPPRGQAVRHPEGLGTASPSSTARVTPPSTSIARSTRPRPTRPRISAWSKSWR